MMLHEPSAWLNRAVEQGAGIQSNEKISKDELIEELILMGLRLKNGIDDVIFQNHFDQSLEEILDFKKLEMLASHGLISTTKNNIKIPDKSRLLTNSIIKKVCEMV